MERGRGRGGRGGRQGRDDCLFILSELMYHRAM